MAPLPSPPCRHHPHQIKRFLSAPVFTLPGHLFPLRKRLPISFSTKPLPGTHFLHPENFPALSLPLTSASAPAWHGIGGTHSLYPAPLGTAPLPGHISGCPGPYPGTQGHIWMPKCTSGCPNAHLPGQADPTSLSSLSQLGGRGRAHTHECDSKMGCSVSPRVPLSPRLPLLLAWPH